LECGLFKKAYPDLDMVSIGPTIKGAHSPEERVSIPSVERFWQLLTATLAAIPREEQALN
jgi:dipeptidase D